MANGYSFNEEKLHKAVAQVFQALKKQRGIFRNGRKHFLPQWRLPQGFEHKPQQQKPKLEYETSLWLWTRMFCDRRSQSEQLMQLAKSAWGNPERRWIFYPEKVAEQTSEKIEQALKQYLHYALANPNEKSVGNSFRDNALKLKTEYQGDPRNLITGKTIAQARDTIMSFDKYGTGLANLLIMEMMDRELVNPIDPENVLFKIDVHKERFALMVDAILITNREISIKEGYATSILEESYRRFCHDKNLTLQEMIELDSALWIIGSKVCATKSHVVCAANCPLEERCTAYPEKDDQQGRFIVYDQDRKRVDLRRGSPAQPDMLKDLF